ncbi:hypothetical protein [Kutzneria sp. 744]|uniref:hypothetical protein n=1 Tax=Kutzneria sp. (strain 744) TaxID=345341 RepID=UPI0003EEA7BF|nr:hypothetical protein [Kutzneria sp. 744]EWM14116.1 large secreted protein [Kutzneria sp. 744]
MARGTSRFLSRAAGITLAAGMIAAGLAAPALADPTAPGQPTSPAVDQHSCGAQPLLVGLNSAGSLSVVPDGADQVTTEFDWWPVDRSDQRGTAQTSGVGGTVAAVTVGNTGLSDGTTYAWQARSSDGAETGPWSDVCEFTTDFTAPGKPAVSSPDYPPTGGTGRIGKPGRFTFSANGSTDVVGFRYGPNRPGAFVPASDGAVTVWITPTTFGIDQVVVTSVDAAGNISGVTTYRYYVPEDGVTSAK